MANTERRYRDRRGNTFIPMNVDGGSWNENFMTTTKMVALGILAAVLFLLVVWLKDSVASLLSWICVLCLYVFGAQFVLRYVVFEEKYYYAMYKQRKIAEITTPSTFWNIASVKNTSDGAVLVYSDAKVGIVVRLERDTITGKDEEFRERHYDAISDFYRELNTRLYSYVQCDLMDPAGNDPRLPELDKLINKSSNKNLVKLIEMMVGHIRYKTRHTLFETDYILVYTSDMSRTESIITDTIECLFKLMDGAFIGYSILNGNGIIEMIKEQYGVKYFDYSEATLDMFRSNGVSTEPALTISRIEFSNGDSQEIGNVELKKLNNLASGFSGRASAISKGSIHDTVFSSDINEINFDQLSESLLDPDYADENIGVTRTHRQSKLGLGRKTKKVARGSDRPNSQQSILDLDSDIDMLNQDEDRIDI